MPDSVTQRKKLALIELMKLIDGSGDYNYDIEDRAFPHLFMDQKQLPVVAVSWVDFTRVYDQHPQSQSVTHVDQFVIEGLVPIPRDEDSDSSQAEDLVADILRAVESEQFQLLRTGTTQSNGKPAVLLSEPINVIGAEKQDPEPGADFQRVSVNVSCAHLHKIGDPNYVFSENN